MNHDRNDDIMDDWRNAMTDGERDWSDYIAEQALADKIGEVSGTKARSAQPKSILERKLQRQLREIIDCTIMDAGLAGHVRVTTTHLLINIMMDKSILNILRIFGASYGAIFNKLMDVLDKIPKPASDAMVGDVKYTRELDDIFSTVRQRDSFEITTTDIFVDIVLASHSTSAMILQNQGIKAGLLLRYVVHGVPPFMKRNSAGIIILSDNYYARLQGLASIIQTKFGLSEKSSISTIKNARKNGYSFVGFYNTKSITKQVSELNWILENEGYPTLFAIVESSGKTDYEQAFVASLEPKPSFEANSKLELPVRERAYAKATDSTIEEE